MNLDKCGPEIFIVTPSPLKNCISYFIQKCLTQKHNTIWTNVNIYIHFQKINRNEINTIIVVKIDNRVFDLTGSCPPSGAANPIPASVNKLYLLSQFYTRACHKTIQYHQNHSIPKLIKPYLKKSFHFIPHRSIKQISLSRWELFCNDEILENVA